MAWIELELHLPGATLEAWSDALLAAGALAVGIEDEDADTADEVAAYGEPGLAPPPAWRHNRVTVLLEAGLDAPAWLRAVAATLDDGVPELRSQRVVEDQDWVRRTQAQFAPIEVGRLAIVPSWHEPPPGAKLVVRIDPGAAFGTGSHATTRLCLSWMTQSLEPGATVLDYGCGSGILSICAARLGAAQVAGVDIDPQAVQTARLNAQANGVDGQYTTPDALDPGHRYDLVVANILANPLVVLAPALVRRVRPGGHLLLCGILERQAQEVIAAYREAGLALEVCGRDDAWVALAGTA